MKNPILRAVAYARFSSNNQREESIDAQLRAIDEYAERNNIIILERFTDEAQTATKDDRDDFQNMINKIMKGYIKVDVVLVHKFNRFARNKYDSVIHKKRLKDMGIKVVSVTQKIEDTPEGAMLESFLEAMDEYYSANLALEVKKGLRENALKGKSTGGKKILGLSVDENGNYYPDENAPIVKRIFEEYANGVPKTEICRRLNDEGYRNQYGRTFNTRTLYDMLRNEKYIGNYIYTISHSETIRLDGIIQNPIIDNDLWERTKAVRSNPSKAKYRQRKRYYYLTGKITCAVCGEKIAGAGAKKQKNGDEYSYYKCTGKTNHKNGCDNPSLNKEWFENKVLKLVIKTVLSNEAIENIAQIAFDEVVANRERPPISTEKLQKELTQISIKQSKLMELYLDGELDKEMLNNKNDDLKSRRTFLEKQIEKNKRMEQSQTLQKNDIKNFIMDYKKRMLELKHCNDKEFMSAIFATFVNHVTVSKDEVIVAIHADFSRMGGGDTVRFAGAIRTISPIVLTAHFARKTNVFGRNSDK